MNGVLAVLGRLVVCVLAVAMAQPSATIGAAAHAADSLAHDQHDQHDQRDHHGQQGHDHDWRDLGRAHAHADAHDAAEPDPHHLASLLDADDLQGRSAVAPILVDIGSLPADSMFEDYGLGRAQPTTDLFPRHKPPPLRSRLNVLRI